MEIKNTTMKNLRIYSTILIALFTMTFISSCKDDSTPPVEDEGGEKKEQVEGVYTGTWISTNEQLPSPQLRDDYQYLELTNKEDDSYTWNWIAKPGGGRNTLRFAGTVQVSPREDKHTSGSKFWWIGVWVSTLNGQAAPGGWEGIFTYENPTTLKLNVEPSVDGWLKWPQPELGLGSGASGDKSIYTFTKKK
jgi:hypothetical protein